MGKQGSGTQTGWLDVQPAIIKLMENIKESPAKQDTFANLAHENHFLMNWPTLQFVTGNVIFSKNPEVFGLTPEDANLIIGHVKVTRQAPPEAEEVIGKYFPPKPYQLHEHLFESHKPWDND